MYHFKYTVVLSILTFRSSLYPCHQLTEAFEWCNFTFPLRKFSYITIINLRDFSFVLVKWNILNSYPLMFQVGFIRISFDSFCYFIYFDENIPEVDNQDLSWNSLDSVINLNGTCWHVIHVIIVCLGSVWTASHRVSDFCFILVTSASDLGPATPNNSNPCSQLLTCT